MEAIDELRVWRARTPTAGVLEKAPDEAVGSDSRQIPLRKAPGFKPAVQRWSVQIPVTQTEFRVAYFGAEADDKDSLDSHPLHDWVEDHLVNHPFGPTCVEHSRSTTAAGRHTHAICAYWVDEERFTVWENDDRVEAWWQAPERLRGTRGVWREVLRIPRNRQETLYWLDFPKGLSCSAEVSLYPTPYCGYYGSMRDRLMSYADDLLHGGGGPYHAHRQERRGFGEHWSISAPNNLTVIRGGSSWGFMGAEQLADYESKLREPVTKGMDYLAQNPLPSGCASMRWQASCDKDGNLEPDEYTHSYFLSLNDLENWAEKHGSHAAIFSAAIQRYLKYGSANELRTWHEVFVLPKERQRFEYLNCHPSTGLLSWFEGKCLRDE